MTFDVFIPERGFRRGVERWLPGWITMMRGQPFLFQAFVSARVGRPDTASAWRGESMSKQHLMIAWRWILSPLYSTVQLKQMRLTLHGPRHLLPEISAQFGLPWFSRSDRNELGRWAGSDAAASFGRSKDSDMADLYAREGPAHDSELRIRLKVIDMVASFIADRDWRLVVPFQRGEISSFSFLSSPDVLGSASDRVVSVI